MAIHKRLAKVRRAARVSQYRLGQLVNLPQTVLSQYERGTLALRPEQVRALENALQWEIERTAKEARRLADQFAFSKPRPSL